MTPPTTPTVLAARPPGAASRDEAAPSGPEDEQMTHRPGWTTVSIPTPLYRAAKKHSANQGISMQAYCHWWIRLGVAIDSAMLTAPQGTDLTQRIIDVLREVAKTGEAAAKK